MNAVPATPIREMFDALVPEYDRFNRISSLGLDVGWRRELTRMFQPGARILDVGTGTGDLAKELAGSASEVIGVDFAEKMVAAAADKLRAEKKIQFQVASADDLPFGPRSFDGIASAFVVRNLHHGGVLGRSFREFFRVLRPGGQMVHLELARPPRGVLSWGHQAYLKLILPVIGRMNFGQRWPKDYLEKTIANFPAPHTMCQQMRWAGFERVCYYPLSGGIAGLYMGTRC